MGKIKWIEGPPKIVLPDVVSLTDEEKIQIYREGERNAWKYAYLSRRLKVGL
jgi:hypothetical protein